MTAFTFTGPYLIPATHRLTIPMIQRHVARYYGLPVEEMLSNSRCQCVARPRQVAMYLARRRTHNSLPQIGRRFGKRDHTTVIHAIRQIERHRKTNPDFDEEVRELEGRL